MQDTRIHSFLLWEHTIHHHSLGTISQEFSYPAAHLVVDAVELEIIEEPGVRYLKGFAKVQYSNVNLCPIIEELVEVMHGNC